MPLLPTASDPIYGALPEVQHAVVEVVVLPGNGIDSVDEEPDSLERLECAIWASGDVVWSDAKEPGAAPHRHARISSEAVQALTAALATTIERTPLRDFGIPDTSHEQICVRTQGRELVLVSCHELFESNPNFVALSNGVTRLESRTRDDALANEPADFLAFRRTWSEVKQAIRASLPKDGELVDRAKLATLGLK